MANKIMDASEWWENGMLSDSELTRYVPPDTPVTMYHAWHSCGTNNFVRVKAKEIGTGDESFWVYKNDKNTLRCTTHIFVIRLNIEVAV